MLEISQDTLIAIQDTTISLKITSSITVDSLASLPDTLLVKNTNSSSNFDEIVTFITVVMAVIASLAAAASAFFTFRNRFLEKRHYYYDLIVVSPCANIIEDYSKEFRNILNRISTKSHEFGIESLINNILVPEWDNLHQKTSDDLNSRTKNWKENSNLNEKIVELAIQLEDQIAEKIDTIMKSDNIEEDYDPEELKSILYSKKGEMIQVIQEFDPYFLEESVSDKIYVQLLNKFGS